MIFISCERRMPLPTSD